MTDLHTAAANVLSRAGVLETVGGYLVNSGDDAATLLPMVRDLHALTLACRELHTAIRVNPDTQTAAIPDKPRVWRVEGADNMRYDPELVKVVEDALREGER